MIGVELEAPHAAAAELHSLAADLDDVRLAVVADLHFFPAVAKFDLDALGDAQDDVHEDFRTVGKLRLEGRHGASRKLARASRYAKRLEFGRGS